MKAHFNPDRFAGRSIVRAASLRDGWDATNVRIFIAGLFILVLCGAFAAPSLRAQAPAQPKQTPPAQQNPKPPAETNPFPENTNNVPVMPNASSPAAPASPETAAPPMLPSDESDPVRSPDDPAPEAPGSGNSSSSSAGIDLRALMPSDDDTRRNAKPQPPEHTETAKEDESVGSLYLSDRDWRGALSRFESALVLDPENPDVYWGLAEAQRHLGQFAAAKANYEKVMEYDPDSKHAKDAKKLLKEPVLANAGSAPAKP